PQAGGPAGTRSPAVAKLAAITSTPAAGPPQGEPLPVLEAIDDLPAASGVTAEHLPALETGSALHPGARPLRPGARQSLQARPKRKKPGTIPPYVWTWSALGSVLFVLLAAVLSSIFPAAGLVFAILFLAVGLIVSTVAGVWLLCIAFMEDVVCGLLYLFLPFYSLYYVITRWSAVKVQFLSTMGGSALMFAGLFFLVLGIVDQAKTAAPGGGPFASAGQAAGAPVSGGDAGGQYGASSSAGQPGGLTGSTAHNPPALAPAVAAADPTAPFNLRDVRFPAFAERGPSRSQWAGIDWFEIHLGPTPPSTPGHGGKLWLYLPQGQHAAKTLPCVMIAPGGSVLFTGMGLAEGGRAEHLPYVQNGFAVIAYELDGALPVPDTTSDAHYAEAYHAFRTSRAGLVNARIAMEYVLNKVPEVDPERIYAAGHSSAATHALLFAAHEPRIKGCVAFAPAVDVPTSLLPVTSNPGILQVMPGIQDFAVQSSPHTHEARLNCPVLLFCAQDDSQAVVQGSSAMATRLRQQGKPVELIVTPSGGHHQSMIGVGIPKAIEWFKKLAQPANQPGP
ncbi:MAG: prolyl oligopeptidase family serine peptidase, partial [Pirellulales bacterium]